MSLTLEERDPYTAGHQRRTTDLSLAIAREMQLPELETRGLQMAGLIHDMGKISVPAEILSKPGRLNDVELQLIQRHPQVAYDILNKLDLPWSVDQIVLQHHEKYNGSGYPQGLAGENILLESRILCVADVVETMETHRPYRPSLGRDAALEEIVTNRGILYDPQVVDACLRLFTESDFRYSMGSARLATE
jgi:HD-GYP domain-containing protein (c-di-GMP phosphodiesterase class II)